MVSQKITTALLMLMLVIPSIPAYSDCGCGGPPVIESNDKSAESALGASCCSTKASETKTCCGGKSEKAAVGCCGNSGDACKCSDAPCGCQCGDNCRCGEASESPASEPITPPAESETNNLATQLISDSHAVATFDEVSLAQRPVTSTRVEVDCYTSAERCSQLCRFLR